MIQKQSYCRSIPAMWLAIRCCLLQHAGADTAGEEGGGIVLRRQAKPAAGGSAKVADMGALRDMVQQLCQVRGVEGIVRHERCVH